MDYSKHVCAEPNGRDEMQMKYRIHYIEKDAYSSVLRAFIAQSDLLSWAKEELITNLRKELHVTDAEHGKLLVEINTDEPIIMIRKWRKSNPLVQHSVNTLAPAASSIGNTLQKLSKTDSCTLNFQRQGSHYQPSSATSVFNAFSHDNEGVSGGKGKGSVRFQPTPSSDSQYSGSRLSGGKGKGVLNSQPMLSSDAPYSGSKVSGGKGKGLINSQPMLSSDVPYSFSTKKIPDFIQIRATEKLIDEVEMIVRGRKCSDPAVEKAKEHEKSILEALAKVSEVLSPDNNSPNEIQPDFVGEFHVEKRQKVNGSCFPGQEGR